MNKYRITNPNNNKVREYKSRTTEYCANNPVMLVDPDGRKITDYRNRKGELLYKTNDKLNDIIVIPDNKIKEFQNKLNVLYGQGKLNDAKANKENLHVLGVKIENLKDCITTKNESIDIGMAEGYKDGYSEKKRNVSTKILRFIAGAEPENSDINSGYIAGKPYGEHDKKQGNINKLDPYSSLKKNKPLLDPQKNNKKMNTNNKID